MAQLDYSTINCDWARKHLKPYKQPPTYQIDRQTGVGCGMDAPGFPSYFVQSVYTQYGNTPPRGAEHVIYIPDSGYYELPRWDRGLTWDQHRANWDRVLRKLWLPLPEWHGRVQLWIAYCYGWNTSYLTGEPYPKDHVYWPPRKWELPTLFVYSSRTVSPERYAELYDQAVHRRRAQIKQMYQHAWKYAQDINNYAPVVNVRKFYPDHQPVMEYVEHKPKLTGNSLDWIYRQSYK